MIKHLMKVNIKSNLGIFIFVVFMLMLYTTISVSMFNPESASTTQAMLEMMPEGMVKAFGFDGLGTDMTSYLSNYLFGFIYLVFPMIFTVVVSNKLICKHVDSGSMTYLLSTPHSRRSIASTQAIYLVVASFLLIFINTSIAILMSEIMFPGKLEIMKYLAINLVTYLCIFVISGFGFFLSCLFNDTKNSLAIGTSIPIFFVVIKMVSNISDDLSFLRFFSLYSLVDIGRILSDNTYTLLVSIFLAVLGSIIYMASIHLFDKRSLSI